MPDRMQKPMLICQFDKGGKDLSELIIESFRSFLYKEITYKPELR